MNLEEVMNFSLDSTFKGIPEIASDSLTVKDVARMGWNVLAGDLPVPVATIDRDILDSNSRWMRQFTNRFGLELCPHGKTTMAPQLFQLQLEDGAWGITVASVQQLRVCTRFGVRRVFMANQLVGSLEIEAVIYEINANPQFDFYCLVDSLDNVDQLTLSLCRHSSKRPLKVLVELGLDGGRAGCRSREQALEVAARVKDASPYLELAGVEGFEAVLPSAGDERDVELVVAFIDRLIEVLIECGNNGFFNNRKPILSIGGSMYIDLVVTHAGIQRLANDAVILLRAGCYLTHDSGMLTENYSKMQHRGASLASFGPSPKPALSVWARIQSIPEPELAIANVGKRDISYDVDLPIVEKWFQNELHEKPVDATGRITSVDIHDQHLLLHIPKNLAICVGDLVSLGVSHPCTTFDKWKLLYLVDQDYNVIDGVLTFF